MPAFDAFDEDVPGHTPLVRHMLEQLDSVLELGAKTMPPGPQSPEQERLYLAVTRMAGWRRLLLEAREAREEGAV